MSSNWMVRNGKIYAPYLNGGRMFPPAVVGSVLPGLIRFNSKNLQNSPSKVFNFIKGHQKELGTNKLLTVSAPFRISADGLRKVAGGKADGKWVYQYKPDSLKRASMQNATKELQHAKKIKRKLTKYVQQLDKDVKSIEKMKKGLMKLRDGL